MTFEKLDKKVKRKYRRIADTILIIHGFWAGLIAVSVPIVFVTGRFRKMSLFLVILNILSWQFWEECPLNIIEREFRGKYNPLKKKMMGFPGRQIRKYLKIDIPGNLVKYFMYSYALVLLFLILI